MHLYSIIKTTRLGDARLSVVGVAGWPVTVGVVEVGVSANQEQTLSGTGARIYTAYRGWLSVVTGISVASTGGVLVFFTTGYGFKIISGFCSPFTIRLLAQLILCLLTR